MAVARMGDDVFGSLVFRFEGKQGKRMRIRTRHTREMNGRNAEMREENC